MAIDEINAAGGANGRPLKLEVVDIDMLTPEGTQSAFQALVDKNVDAIVSPFSITWQPGIDVTAAAEIPYLSGGTSSPAIAYAKSDPEKFFNFVSDPAELNYGVGFIQSLDLLVESGKWTPKNNKVDIVVGDSEYNTLIADGTKQAIADSGGKWELGEVSDVQGGITDWSPILQKLAAVRRRRDHDRPLDRRRARRVRAAVQRQPGAGLARVPAVRPVPARVPRHRRRGGGGLLLGHHDRRARHGQGRGVPPEVHREVPGSRSAWSTPAGATTWSTSSRTPGRTSTRPTRKAVMEWIKSHPYDGTTGHIDFSNVETPVYPENAATPEDGRHAPVLPGAGRRAQDRAARGLQAVGLRDASVGLGG